MKSYILLFLFLAQIVGVQAQNPYVDWIKCTKNSDCSVSNTGFVD